MNWKLREVILIILIAMVPMILGGCNQAEDGSAMFCGNLERTGEYADSGPRKLTELKWKFKTEDSVTSSPAISNRVVYFGSIDGYLYALR